MRGNWPEEVEEEDSESDSSDGMTNTTKNSAPPDMKRKRKLFLRAVRLGKCTLKELID